MSPGERALEARTDPRCVLGTREIEPVQLVPLSSFSLLFLVQNNNHRRNLEKIRTSTKTKMKTHVVKPTRFSYDFSSDPCSLVHSAQGGWQSLTFSFSFFFCYNNQDTWDMLLLIFSRLLPQAFSCALNPPPAFLSPRRGFQHLEIF